MLSDRRASRLAHDERDWTFDRRLVARKPSELVKRAGLRQSIPAGAANVDVMMFRYQKSALSCAVCAALSACSLAPPYERPSVPAPPQAYQGAEGWKVARPADRVERGAWWRVYRDPLLDQLEGRVDGSNQDIRAGFARLEQARAQTRVARAEYFPTVSANATVQHYRNSMRGPNYSAAMPTVTSDLVLNTDLSYEADVWGRVRNSVSAAGLGEQASVADFAVLSLAVHAELAGDYFILRGADAEQEILDQTVSDYARALALTERLHEGGLAAKADVDQARAQLESARTRASETHLLRAQAEHAIGVLLGESPSIFRLHVNALSLEASPPSIDPGLPSELLERRPDIAAAERRVAASNAQIGVARAAYFPVFNLLTAAGFESTQASTWISAPARIWSFGPQAMLTLFDAGRRRAQTAQTLAAHDEKVAEYRGTVLAAYQDVEDSLTALHDLELESRSEDAAVDSTAGALKQSQYQYQTGLVTYLQVVVTENAALAARLAAVEIAIRRLNASVLLIKALGGGWGEGQ